MHEILEMLKNVAKYVKHQALCQKLNYNLIFDKLYNVWTPEHEIWKSVVLISIVILTFCSGNTVCVGQFLKKFQKFLYGCSSNSNNRFHKPTTLKLQTLEIFCFSHYFGKLLNMVF